MPCESRICEAFRYKFIKNKNQYVVGEFLAHALVRFFIIKLNKLNFKK